MTKTTLVGKKVTIRKLKITDADSITSHINDKTVARWTINVPHPYRKKDALKFIRSRQVHGRNRANYTFGIAEKESDEIIGCIDLVDIDWEDKKAETGYWISRVYRGQGLTTEALNLILRFAFRDLKLHKIYARVFKENRASMKVLEKNGFKREGILRKEIYKYGRWVDEYYFGLLKSEYRKL